MKEERAGVSSVSFLVALLVQKAAKNVRVWAQRNKGGGLQFCILEAEGVAPELAASCSRLSRELGDTVVAPPETLAMVTVCLPCAS